MWGMDVIGPITPKSSNDHRFILVVIDYFMKWVEAESYARVTKEVVTRFVKNNLVCRFGLPESIISDNAKFSTTTYDRALSAIPDHSQAFRTLLSKDEWGS